MALAKRKIKFSSSTRKYLRDKYSVSASKLTYLINYSSECNEDSIKIISDGIEYETTLRKDYNKLMDKADGLQVGV